MKTATTTATTTTTTTTIIIMPANGKVYDSRLKDAATGKTRFDVRGGPQLYFHSVGLQ